MIVSAIGFTLSILLSSQIFPPANSQYPILQRHPENKNSSFLSVEATRNLKRVLDYIYVSPEFQPLVLSVIFPNTQPDIGDFVSRYTTESSINAYKVKANDFSSTCSWKYRTDLTWIFLVDEICTLNAFLHWQREFWMPTNEYLIVLTDKNILLPYEEIFRMLWMEYGVYKCMFLSIRDDFGTLIKFLPFDVVDGKRGGIQKIPVNQTEDFSNETHLEGAPLLSETINLFEKFQNLKGHLVKVVLFRSLMMAINVTVNGTTFSRLDADVMNLLEKSLGVVFHQTILDKVADDDDPFHRALKMIENGDADMILTSFFMKHYDEFSKYQFTVGVYEDKLCFIAPAAGTVPKSYMPIMPFNSNLWFILGVYNVVITILWFIVKYCSRSFRRGKPVLLPLSEESSTIRRLKLHSRETVHFAMESVELSDLSEESLRKLDGKHIKLTISQEDLISDDPAEIQPYVLSCFELFETLCYRLKGGETDAQKAFLFGTLFFGLIVTGLYESCLVSSLSKPFHYPELDTLEDVADSNLTVITKYRNLKTDTFTEGSELSERLKRKIQVVNWKGKTHDIIAFKKNVIALGRYSSIKLENAKYYDEDGGDLLHIVDECPATYILSYVVGLHSPYLRRINELLQDMHKSGLIQRWYNEIMYPIYVNEQRRKLAMSERKIKLTLRHYSLTFAGWFVGLFCCTIVFIVEVYYAWRKTG